MSQTIRDILVECENWQYSQERYNLLKESANIMLREQYLADQRFIAENAESMKGIQISKNYLFESTEEDKITEITESIGDSAKNIWATVKATFKKLVHSIVTFFEKHFGKIFDLNKRADMIIKRANEKQWTNEDLEKLNNSLETIAANMLKVEGGFEVVKDSSNTPDIKINVREGGASDVAMIGFNKVQIRVKGNDAMEINELVDCMSEFMKSKEVYHLKSLNTKIKEAMSKPFFIKCDTKSNESAIKRLKELDTAVQSAFKADVEKANSDNVQVGNVDFDGGNYGEFMDAINKAVPATIKLYSQYSAIKAQAIDIVDKMV